MTSGEWHEQWHRLDHFRISAEADRNDLELEWFAQLKHFHVDAVEHGITQLIGTATDNFLPGLGLLREYIHARLGRYDKVPGKCATCHGSGWKEAAPFKSNNLIYANTVERCLDCGIPEPKLEGVNRRRESITEVQRHEYQAGRFGRDQMPPGLEAKHPEKPGNPELRQMIAAFRAKFANKEDLA